MGMIREYHSHTLQTNLHHREEEPQNTNSHLGLDGGGVSDIHYSLIFSSIH